MATEKILYTDGSDVTVTDSTFRVRKHSYRLNGITKHSFSIVKPNRAPGIFTVGLSLLLLAIGVNGNFSVSQQTIHVASVVLELKMIFSIAGALLLVGGIVFTVAMKEKYGVHLVTVDGEKDVLVSDRREYVWMIVEALNKAFINMIHKPGEDDQHAEPPLRMSVSHR